MDASDVNPPCAGGALTQTAEAALGTQALCGALLDSRQRWRDLVTMTADFVFETDATGRFVFVAPAVVLGWPAEMMLGQPATLLLVDPSGFDPFNTPHPTRDRRCWLKRADDGVACLAFACAPLEDDEHDGGGSDPSSNWAGCRGIAHDVTAQHAREAATAASLRRGELIEHILWQMRQEVLAPRMMQAVLEELLSACGAAGAAVVDLLAVQDDLAAVLHTAGDGAQPLLSTIYQMLHGETLDPVTAASPAGHYVLACPSYTRFGERAGLAIWRQPEGEPWNEEDRLLASATTAIVRVVLEHEAIQRELARQARTDPLTGLLNRRAFFGEIDRRIDRLDRDGLPGTLMYVDLDYLKLVNDLHGHDFGDKALVLTASLLRDTVRPADLVARLGGDEFAVWLDGSDGLTAAERAEALRVNAPAAYARVLPTAAQPLSMSIGISARRAGSGETLDSLMQRADAALYEVKRAGRGHWRVARDECLP